MANNVYFEDVEIGQEIPAFERETDFMNWNRYAAVNEEFVYVHMDDEAGQAAGQGAAFGMGNLRWAYVLNALRDWAGDEAQIRELSLQFRAINHKHDHSSAPQPWSRTRSGRTARTSSCWTSTSSTRRTTRRRRAGP